jgi:hypothetical protein
MNGAVLRVWYKNLDKYVGSSMTDLKGVIIKCALDQIVYAPAAIASFFAYSEIIDLGFSRDTATVIEQKCKSDVFRTWLVDCSVWPPANYICFRYISLAYRPAFVCVIQLGWQIYLSSVAAIIPSTSLNHA